MYVILVVILINNVVIILIIVLIINMTNNNICIIKINNDVLIKLIIKGVESLYLYILKFKKMNIIKIGIAKNFNRIRQHQSTYGDIIVDLQESYRVTAKNKADIKLLEKQLLEDYNEYKVNVSRLNMRDGYTELREDMVLKMILEDITYKAQRFPNKSIKIEKGISIPKQKTNMIKKDWKAISQKTQDENKTRIDNWLTRIKKHKANITSICITDNHINIMFNNINYEIIDYLLIENIYVMYREKGSVGGYNIVGKNYFKETDSSDFSAIEFDKIEIIVELIMPEDFKMCQGAVDNLREEVVQLKEEIKK